MIIELFGLPGSGKTAIKKVLIRRDFGKDVVLNGTLERLIFCFVFAILHPLICLFWLSLLFTRDQKGLRKYKLSLLSVTFAKFQKARFLKQKSIIDEGFLQRILSMYEHQLTEQEIKKTLKYSLFPDKVLFIKGGGFDRFLKEEDRINSYRYKKGEAYIENWISILTSNTELIHKQLQNSFPTLLNEFDNSQRASLDEVQFVL